MSAAKSPCNSIGSGRLWDLIMLCYAVTVPLLPEFSRLILRWALSTRSAGVWLLGCLTWSRAVISNIAWELCKWSQSQNLLLRKRLRSIWSQANQLGNEDQTDKAAKNHNWVAWPRRPVTVGGPPFSVPRYLHLDLGRQTQHNVARVRLHSHALRVETRSWEHHDGTCDKCGLQAIQD